MAKSKWTTDNIPDQTGKTIIITGATSGLGKQATRVLAKKNAQIVMAIRNTEKGETLVKEILNEYPNAKIEIQQLDLNSLESVSSFSSAFISHYD
jgi:short-subunit dehydrogenase